MPYDPATCTSVSVPDPVIEDNCEVSKLTWTMSGATTGNSPSEGINMVGSQVLGFGTTTILYDIEDIHGNTQNCSFDVTVAEGVTTSTIAVEPTPQQYSDKVTFTATITGGASNCGPQAAEAATFYIGVQNMGSAPFLPSGANLVATLSNVPLVEGVAGQMSPGVKTVSAIFSGIDMHYDVSQPSDINLTITKENANVEYNGQEYFSTPNQNNCTGIITLSTYIEDFNDGCPGDIRNSTITFYRDVIGGSILGTPDLPVGLVNPANFQEGIAITDFTHTLTGSNCSSGGETFEVWAAAGNYYTGSTPEATLVTLALPGNEFVTGGGHLVMEQSEGSYAATDGSKMNFGFNMKWNPSGKNLQGKINIIFRRWIEYQNVLQ